ncbi:hypothetical protein ARAM_003618 [Aspergillus rambellii]|uniref:DNA2/NAM7 helicase-like C-terminal domain-containing protein n=1 Tax=Aspergillus rambellii TaxID=308745 RepID=A0A0F8V5Y9_9EURO|nr:hypothetical protein ARAM_003618 [Aspergillus rambellii]
MEDPKDAKIINFTQNLNRTWHTYVEAAPKDHVQDIRNLALINKCLYPPFDNCGLCTAVVKEDFGTWQQISSTGNTRLFFSIGGGADIPYFSLRLRLGSHAGDFHDLDLTAIWTAWHESDYGYRRPVNEPWTTPRDLDKRTFSSRLRDVEFQICKLDEYQAERCGGKAGAPCCRISWAHKDPPYRFNFPDPRKHRNRLRPMEYHNLEIFDLLRRPHVMVSVVTREIGLLIKYWTFMTAIPVPTPPLFPNCDCRFNPKKRCIEPITKIPLTVDRARNAMQIMNIGSVSQSLSTIFINSRHYEAAMTMDILCDMQHQESYLHILNYDPKIRLFPVTDAYMNITRPIDGLFYAIVDMCAHGGDNDLGPGFDLSLPSPAPGTLVEVKVQIKGQNGADDVEFRCKEVVVSGPPCVDLNWYCRRATNPICIQMAHTSKMLKFHSAASFNVIELPGKVSFLPSVLPHAQAQSAVQSLIHGNSQLKMPSDNWLQSIILAQDNGLRKFFSTPWAMTQQVTSYMEHFQQSLNADQMSAIISGLNCDPLPELLFTLICGGPGTGKTLVSAHIMSFCLDQNIPFFILGSSASSLEALEDRFMSVSDVKGLSNPSANFYRLDFELGDCHERRMANGYQHRWFRDSRIEAMKKTAILNSDFGPEVLIPLWVWLKSRISSESKFSLGAYILRRLKKAVLIGPCGWESPSPDRDKEEFHLLWDVICWYRALERDGCVFDEPLQSDGSTLQSAKDTLLIGFRDALEALQRYYTARGKGILCPARSVGKAALRELRPLYILMENASSISEPACLTALVEHYPSTKKITLVGDSCQSPVPVTSWQGNDCLEVERISLFERLQATGMPAVELRIQYRMETTIARLVSDIFYPEKLQTHASCIDRPPALLYREVMNAFATHGSPGNLAFISVNNPATWRRPNTCSMFNPQYIHCVVQCVRNLVENGFSDDQILVLSYYAEECRELRQALHVDRPYSNVEIATIDSYEGKEKDFVILSTCRPGGQAGLGIVADRKRTCLALSRAKHGLTIIGHERMGFAKDGFRQHVKYWAGWEAIVRRLKRNHSFRIWSGSVLLDNNLEFHETRDREVVATYNWAKK